MRNLSRPRLQSTTHQRSCAKLIRFSPVELRAVNDRARAAGRPVACFVRESSLGSSPRARRIDMSDSLIRLLAQVGTRLAELSRVATQGGLAGAEEFERGVADVLRVIRQLD